MTGEKRLEKAGFYSPVFCFGCAMRVSSRVPNGVRGVLIVDYLAQRFTYLDKRAWLQLVVDGRTWCNDDVCHRDTAVQAGDHISCDLPDFPAPEVNLNYHIVYEDPWLLGINKPPNLRVHSQGKFVAANLMYHLRHQRQPSYPEAQLVNRLDADTSGIVVLARSPDVKRALAAQFAAGDVEKVYLAVVHGTLTVPAGIIDLPVGQVMDSGLRHRQGVVVGGKTAVTHYKTVAVFQEAYSLVELRPQTGRTHQLRVHLAAMGHPIVGDALYTMDDEAYLHWLAAPQPKPEMQGMARQALHCQETRFTHPITSQLCAITAPLPQDMQTLLARLSDPSGK